MVTSKLLSIILCYLLTTVCAAVSTKYIVKFDDDILLARQKYSRYLSNYDYFYKELSSIIDLSTVTPVNNYSLVFQGLSFSSSDPNIMKSVKSLIVVDEVWVDSVITKRDTKALNDEASSEKVLFSRQTTPDNSIDKRALFPEEAISKLLKLKYIYGNQTKYYESCLGSSYTFNPPKPAENASIECKNYYTQGWENPSSCKPKPSAAPSSPSSPAQAALKKLAAINTGGWKPFAKTHVTEVHDEGITGKDVVIGFLDTGVDSTHPALKGKFLGGYDFIGDNYDGSNTPQPDNDPNDTDGHGTEVAGVALGNSPILTGVAPDAKFRMYRTFTGAGATSVDIVLSAIERAASDKVDIISISGDDTLSWAFNPFSIAVSRVSNTGIIIIFSAGNAGDMGPYYGSSGSSSNAVIVGNMQTDKLVAWPAYIVSDKSDTPQAVNYVSTLAGVFSLDGVFDIDYVPRSFCTTDGFPAKKNSILLMPFAKNSECSRRTQFTVASKLGYERAIFIEQDSLQYIYSTIYPLESPLIEAAAIPSAAASWIADQYKNGASFQMVFNSSVLPQEVPANTPGAGLMNPTSSWGPSYDGFFNPAVSAPGGSVFSSSLNHRYTTVSGTSFSCPYIAGVAALYLEKRGFSKSRGRPAGNDVNAQFKSRVSSYAQPLKWYSGLGTFTDGIAPLVQQGNGLVHAYHTVIGGKTYVDPPFISVNASRDPQHVNTFEITVTNEYKRPVTYTLDSKASLVVNDFEDTNAINFFPPPVATDTERVVFHTNQFTLSPGSSKKVKFDILIDDKPVFKNSMYTGSVIFKASHGPDARVPYIAVTYNAYKSIPVLTQPITFGTYSPDTDFVPGNAPFVFDSSKSKYPQIIYNTNYGTVEYSLDLVSSDFDISKDFTLQDINSSKKSKRNNGSFNSLFSKRSTNSTAGSHKFYGPLRSPDYIFPQEFFARETNFPIISQTAAGQALSPGSYKILQRALKPYGDRFKLTDWEVNLSDEFTIV